MATENSQGSKGQVLVELLVIAIILAAFLQFFFVDGRHGFSDKSLYEAGKTRFPAPEAKR